MFRGNIGRGHFLLSDAGSITYLKLALPLVHEHIALVNSFYVISVN